MPSTSQIEIGKLGLDLKNFRTVPQKKESDAIKAMIAIKPDRFYAVMESIIDDGYLPTENIIVLKDKSVYTVKEGNRRIAALKLILGFHKVKDFNIPESIIDKIKNLDTTWRKENSKVPCTIFEKKEEDKADHVVTLAHGKGEKASRDPWSSVARARHNRDVKLASEVALDLLEKYLKHGQNLNNQQKERWAGDYPLTVLDDAIRKIYNRFGFQTSADFVKKYPKVPMLTELEEIIRDIGLQLIGFEKIRNQPDFALAYGLPPVQVPGNNTPNQPGSSQSTTAASPTTASKSSSSSTPTPTQQPNSPSSAPASTAPTPPAPKAYGTTDPRHVANLLKAFSPRGGNRQKVVTLRDEIKKLKIKDHPFAFCFLLRSMFEISAKAYSADHSISTTNSKGTEKPLADLLRDITNHLTNNNANKGMSKTLHGAIAEIAKPASFLSVTSLNQLVHNPSFSIQPNDICMLFGNVYPLLEAMN